MRIEDFDFHLPSGAAVRTPPKERDGGRLVVVHRNEGKIEHRKVRDLPALLNGRVCYGNDTKISKCRVEVLLHPKNIPVECILIERLSPVAWKAFSKVPLFYKIGERFSVVGGPRFQLLERDPGDHSKAIFQFEEPVDLEACGSYPLPDGCDRPVGDFDWSRLEPLYASVPGSQAHASGGCCLTKQMLEKIDLRLLSLFICWQSYSAVRSVDVRDHEMYFERYQMREAPPKGALAIGSTVMRTLEAYGKTGVLAGETDLFIAPGHEFKVVDGFLTNLHFPMEGVFVMTCAFGGTELVLKAYKEAADLGYKFGDWGDTMLII